MILLLILLIVGLIISIGLNIAAFIVIRNLLVKTDTYEKWILDFKEDVEHTLSEMRAIDKQGSFATNMNDKGTFESDDQVGQVFKELLDLLERLNERTQ